jgi:hypothetical protein
MARRELSLPVYHTNVIRDRERSFTGSLFEIPSYYFSLLQVVECNIILLSLEHETLAPSYEPTILVLKD